MLLKKQYRYLTEEVESDDPANEQNQLMLDLIVNAVFFNEPYLDTMVKQNFPTEQSIYDRFDQETVIDKIMSDKDIEKDEANDLFQTFVSRVYLS